MRRGAGKVRRADARSFVVDVAVDVNGEAVASTTPVKKAKQQRARRGAAAEAAAYPFLHERAWSSSPRKPTAVVGEKAGRGARYGLRSYKFTSKGSHGNIYIGDSDL